MSLMNTLTSHFSDCRTCSPLLGAACAATLLLGGALDQSAAAQDALGSGNVLDANPGHGTGRVNAPSAVPDYRARNLLVTGDVAGGRGFRDAVGYTAAGDFQGDLAEDDLFRFRADSAFSSPAALTSFNQQLRLGQQFGIVEYHRGTQRVPQVPRVGGPMDAPVQSWDLTDISVSDRIRMDQAAQAAAVTERERVAGDMRTVGTVMDEQGRPFFIDASSLRGLAFTSAAERYYTDGLSTLDRIRLREDMASGRVTNFGAPVQWQFQQLLDRDRIGDRRRDLDPRQEPDRMWNDLPDQPRLADREESRIDPWQDPQMLDRDRDAVDERRRRETPQQAQHREIIERIARRYADREDVDFHADPRIMRELDEEFARLRDRLGGRDVWEADPLGTDPLAPQPVEEDEQVDGRPLERWEPEALPGDETYDPTRAIPLLRHGQRVEELTGAERTRFNELMELAEQSLRDGEYFLAERQFIRALRFHPGEPLATAGMAHAQLGAGLYVASSLTLQRLFVTNPEMIDVTYDEGLLPSRARLSQAADELTSRLSQRRDRDSVAFLLAYVGRHMGDDELVEQGLSVFEDERSDDPMVPLLQGLWQGE